MAYLPSIIEKTGRGEKILDLPSRLLQDRIVMMTGQVTPESSDSVIMQLLWLSTEDPKKDITLYLKSPGGSVYDGMAIKDVMDSLPCKVNTVGVGCCASMAAYLLASGTGVRKSKPNNRIMIHSVISGAEGSFHDMKVDYHEAEYLQNKMIEHMTQFTKGKTTLEDMQKKCERDYYMNPEEALKMGLIDEIG